MAPMTGLEQVAMCQVYWARSAAASSRCFLGQLAVLVDVGPGGERPAHRRR